jgi:hypothetical protein
MQQNIRAAMYYMQREIRMAGSNPFKSLPLSSFGIIAACQNSINITEDLRGLATGSSPDGDVGDPDENIIYSLDANRNLIRTTGGVLIGCVPNGGNSQIIVQNIDALDFVYLDGNGAVTANIPDMRSVQITIVARTNDPLLYGTTNNITYQNQQGTPIFGPAGDNVSRRRLTTVIHCRNLSL